MKLEDVVNATTESLLPEPLANPFLQDDLLAEADLQKIHWDVAADRCGLLFDLKGAYQYPEANTAIIVARGVSQLSWKGRAEAHRRQWRTLIVGSNSFSVGVEGIVVTVGAVDSQWIQVVAEEVRFWEGNVPGGDDAPPAYDETEDEEIRSRLTSWGSEFDPVATVGRRRA